mmetsp:Transcript_1040/g.1900  ORF Transcript_1040/g.1900 Transcript_1040/m.1900 type:complete len:139 (+) Transcript_1040:588-1004(+)
MAGGFGGGAQDETTQLLIQNLIRVIQTQPPHQKREYVQQIISQQLQNPIDISQHDINKVIQAVRQHDNELADQILQIILGHYHQSQQPGAQTEPQRAWAQGGAGGEEGRLDMNAQQFSQDELLLAQQEVLRQYQQMLF